MDHAVHYRTSAGETRLEEVASLDAAISLVERLRNDEGVSDVRVYRQVPIEFKTYYKVSVVEGNAGSAGNPGNAAGGGDQAASNAATSAPAPQAAAAQPAQSAPQSPPPGAMPLGPSTPSSQPSAQPAAQVSATPATTDNGGGDEGENARRGSLFSRG